jgi:glucosyl-3-phosphoglycerate synthase
MSQPDRAVAMESEAQMLPEVREWLHCHTIESANWTATELADAKGTTRISVVLPARDEDRTVGRIVSTIRRELMDSVRLVDELVVVDSGSSDDTASVAAAAGATVVAQDAVLPHLGCRTGKGEALWKSLAVTTGEVIVFIDADVENFESRFVTGLLGPLLVDPGVGYIKAAYRRPLLTPNGVLPTAGGRVTELVARPLINLHWPLLAGFRQPLAGEYAGRREAFEQVPFAAGYGVEFGLLVDLLELLGLPGLAQVELGIRCHSHQSTPALGRMAGQIMHTAWTRLRRRGGAPDGEPPAATLTQFRYNGGGYNVIESDVGVPDRPPMMSVAAYHARRFAALSRGGHP